MDIFVWISSLLATKSLKLKSVHLSNIKIKLTWANPLMSIDLLQYHTLFLGRLKSSHLEVTYEPANLLRFGNCHFCVQYVHQMISEWISFITYAIFLLINLLQMRNNENKRGSILLCEALHFFDPLLLLFISQMGHFRRWYSVPQIQHLWSWGFI